VKKLVILTPCHSLHGGVEVIVADLARALPSRGWDVVLGLAEGTRFNRPELYEAEYPGLPTTHIDCFSGTSEGRIRALMGSIRKIRPDIVMSARIFDLYEAGRRLKHELPELRLALTIQCYEHDYLIDLARWSSQVDLCITSGELIRQAAIQLCGMESHRVISIPGGVAPCALRATPPSAPLRLGYAGRLDQDQKRVFDLVEIVRTLIARDLDFTFHIAGAGPAETELKGRMSDVAGSKVKFLGWLGSRTSYYKFLGSIDIFLHAAEREGVSIAPREAMACGAVPVISEFTGFWLEGHFLPNVNCLSFPVGDTGMAANQVMRLSKEPALLADLSRAAQASETGIYSETGAMDAWAWTFDECLRLPSKPPADFSQIVSDHGRLSKWGVPPAFAQTLRDLMGIRMKHDSPGAEWPHSSTSGSESFLRIFESFAKEQEDESKGRFLAAKPHGRTGGLS